MTLCAEDKAGNQTSLTITVLNPALTDFDTICLEADKETTVSQNVKKITIPVGETVCFRAYGKNAAGEIPLSAAETVWSILYQRNIVEFRDGVLTALAPGETAVCVVYDVASFVVDGETVTASLTDVIVVEIVERTMTVTKEKIIIKQPSLCSAYDEHHSASTT
jgi:hypothetical protein